MNKTYLYGNVGQEPKLHTPNVLELRIATNERQKVDGEWTDHTEWHTVKVLGKRAEGLSRILNKGDKVLVEGRLQTREYESKQDGGKRWRTEVIANEVELSGKPRGERQQQQTAAPAASGTFEDQDLPF